MLDTVRFLAGFAWFVLFVFLSGSVWRFATGQVKNWRDRQWIILWFVSAIFTGYFLRLCFGLAPALEEGAAYAVTLGLQVLTLLVALRILHLRIELQGYRW